MTEHLSTEQISTERISTQHISTQHTATEHRRLPPAGTCCWRGRRERRSRPCWARSSRSGISRWSSSRGNADLTPTRLVGHHDPARVLREDYSPDNFVPGPLVLAMRSGGFLCVEEFNRAPEDTLSTLLTAMAERRIAIRRVGTVGRRRASRSSPP